MFETSFFLIIAILLGASIIISVLFTIFKIKLFPTFVVEIIVGIVLYLILKEYIINIEGVSETLNVIYVIGFSLIMFLSGYDMDFDLLKDKEKTNKSHVNIQRLSLLVLVFVYLLSFGASFLFKDYFTNYWVGIILLTICFSASFAGIIVPLTQVDKIVDTTLGKVISTFSLTNELFSILLLTLFMIITNIESSNLWSYLIICGLFVLVYLIEKLINKSRQYISDKITYFPIRVLILALAACVFFSELAGGEYVLGAFLLGIFMKYIKVDDVPVKTLHRITFGIFAPMFFMIVGTKLDIMIYVNNPKLLILVLFIFSVLIIVKLPLLYLLRWYKFDVTIMTIFISSCTFVVSLVAAEIGLSIGLFNKEFSESLILASVITCIIPPIIYERILQKSFKNVY